VLKEFEVAIEFLKNVLIGNDNIAEHYLRDRQLCSHSTTSQHFMEPKGSLSLSQQLSTCPYPEADQVPSFHLNIIHTPMFGLPSGHFPSGFSSSSHSCYMLPHFIFLNLIFLIIFLRRVQIQKQFSPPSPHFTPLRSKCSPQHPVLKHPQSFSLP
jgi:hypothetical protein